jgi:cytochrome c
MSALTLHNSRKGIVTAILALGAILACAATQSGASEVNVTSASAKSAQGARLFGQQCASCHGRRGEGVYAPAIMGPIALPAYPNHANFSTNASYTDPTELNLRETTRPEGAPKREPFNTAQDVYNYISKRMPRKAPGSLKPEEYWAILNFMLIAHGIDVAPSGINAANASSVTIGAP